MINTKVMNDETKSNNKKRPANIQMPVDAFK